MASVLQENIKTINELKDKMIETAKESPYFNIINSFYGIGEVLTTELLGELGDITRFDNHNLYQIVFRYLLQYELALPHYSKHNHLKLDFLLLLKENLQLKRYVNMKLMKME